VQQDKTIIVAFDLDRGADFSLKLVCRAGPDDLGGVPGAGFGQKTLENRAEKFPARRLSGAKLKLRIDLS